jgi:hypothetical protein
MIRRISLDRANGRDRSDLLPNLSAPVLALKGRYRRCTAYFGRLLAEEPSSANAASWLPTDADQSHVLSPMKPVRNPGETAPWIVAQSARSHNQPLEFEYIEI